MGRDHVDDAHVDRLALHQVLDARWPQDRDVDKDVLATVVGLDEAEALILVKPFDRAAYLNSRGWIGHHAARRTRAIAERRALRRTLGSSGGVDLEHARDLHALHAVPDRDLELGARRDGLVAGGLQGPDVQKGIACPVAQLDEAKAFVALEPLDDRIDGRRGAVGRRGRRRRTERAAAKSRPRRPRQTGGVERGGTIVVEAALLGSPEISTFAHGMPARLSACRRALANVSNNDTHANDQQLAPPAPRSWCDPMKWRSPAFFKC